MASQQTWDNYHSSNTNKGTDEEIQSMIRDVVETIHTMERMYGGRRGTLVRVCASARLACACEHCQGPQH